MNVTLEHLKRIFRFRTPVEKARATISKAFADDPDFRYSYQANIAMLLHDKFGIRDYAARNKAADDIIKLIFES